MVNDEVLHQNSTGRQGCENFAALGVWPGEEGQRGKGLMPFGWGTNGIYWHNNWSRRQQLDHPERRAGPLPDSSARRRMWLL